MVLGYFIRGMRHHSLKKYIVSNKIEKVDKKIMFKFGNLNIYALLSTDVTYSVSALIALNVEISFQR